MQITDTYSEIADNGAAVLLGVPVDNVSLRDAVRKIGGMVAAYHSKKKPRYVATVNVDFLIKARIISPGKPRDPELLHILRKADLVTADGAPLVTLSRLTRQALKERVVGADLVPALASHAAERGYQIFMLGSDRKTAKKEATILEQTNPGLNIVGIDSPFVHLSGRELSRENESDKTIISKIISTRPDILLLGFGNPKQEVWFERNRYRLDVPVTIGVGGMFSFIAGTVKRAPAWVQSQGVERVFRILQEPRRLWKRYAEGLLKFRLMSVPPISVALLLGKKPVRTQRRCAIRPCAMNARRRFTAFVSCASSVVPT